MTTPTLQVLLDDASNGGTFPYDISAYVRFAPGVKAAPAGRPDEQSSLSPGSLELTLNNADGRFTFGSTSGGYGAINLKRQVRVNATVNGVTTTLFTGPVMSWPVVWESGSVNAFSAVSAVDPLADAERRDLRSVIEETILLGTGPLAYYTLGDDAGSLTASDTSGRASATLSATGPGAAPTFGNATGPGTDGLTGATFTNTGKWLQGRLPVSIGAAGTAWSVVLTLNVPTAPPANARDLVRLGLDLNLGPVLYLAGAGVGKPGFGGLPFGTTPNVCDGQTHQIAATMTAGGTATLYVDGSSVTSGSMTTGGSADVYVGGNPLKYGSASEASTIDGSLFHVAIYDRTLSTAEVASISTVQASLTENAGPRLTRLASFGSIATGSIATGSTVGFKDFTGQSLADALREVAQTDGGILGLDGNGQLTYVSRNTLVSATAPDLTCPSAWLDGSVQPVVDDQRLVNYITVTTDTGAASVATNTSAVSAYGRYPQARDYLVDDLQSAVDRGNWEVAQNAQPTPRVGTLAFNGLARSAAEQAQLLALKPGSWIRITGLPTQFPGGSTADFIVEGLSHDLSADAWGIAVNVVSRSIYGPAWTLGDSTNGVLGSTTRLFY